MVQPESGWSTGQRALLRFLEQQGVLASEPAAPGTGRPSNADLFATFADAIDQQALVDLVARSLRIGSVDLEGFEPMPDLVALIPVEVARRGEVVPIAQYDGTLEVAAANPLDLETVKSVEFTTGLRVRTKIARRADVCRAVCDAYGVTDEAADRQPSPEAPAPAPDAAAGPPAVEAAAAEETPAAEEPPPDPPAAETPVVGGWRFDAETEEAPPEDALAEAVTAAAAPTGEAAPVETDAAAVSEEATLAEVDAAATSAEDVLVEPVAAEEQTISAEAEPSGDEEAVGSGSDSPSGETAETVWVIDEDPDGEPVDWTNAEVFAGQDEEPVAADDVDPGDGPAGDAPMEIRDFALVDDVRIDDGPPADAASAPSWTADEPIAVEVASPACSVPADAPGVAETPTVTRPAVLVVSRDLSRRVAVRDALEAGAGAPCVLTMRDEIEARAALALGRVAAVVVEGGAIAADGRPLWEVLRETTPAIVVWGGRPTAAGVVGLDRDTDVADVAAHVRALLEETVHG